MALGLRRLDHIACVVQRDPRKREYEWHYSGRTITIKGDSFQPDRPRLWSAKKLANVGPNAAFPLLLPTCRINVRDRGISLLYRACPTACPAALHAVVVTILVGNVNSSE